MRIVVASDAGFAAIFDRTFDALHGEGEGGQHLLRANDPSVQAQNDAPHVAAALRQLGHDVVERVLCAAEGDGRAERGDPRTATATADLQRVVDDAPDLVVNLCDSLGGDPQRAPLVPAFLDAHGVAHTGGDAGATALCKRKHDVKAVLVREGLPTPRAQVIHVDDDAGAFRLRLVPPVILKLCGEHASVGIDPQSVCFDEAAVVAKARQLQARFRQAILVEEYVAGREFYVSCVGRPLRPLPLMEHTFAGLPLRTFDKKWLERDPHDVDARFADPVPHRAPARLQGEGDWPGSLDDVGALCARALHVVGWRDWGRVDLRLDKGGVPLIIDVTPMTYLHPDGPCAKAALADDVSYVELWRRIVDGASQTRASS